MKPCRIQIDTGRLNRQWASAMPVTELTMPSTEKSWKIGRVSTTGGVMRKAMKLKNRCLSPRNDSRAKAKAAGRATGMVIAILIST